MTYPEAEEIIAAARTIMQSARSRTEVLAVAINGALEQSGALLSQIPSAPFGGYTEEPNTELVDEINAYSALAVALSARIPNE